MSKANLGKRLLKGLSILILAVVVFTLGLLGFLTIREYKPESVENLALYGTSNKALHLGDTLTVLSFNTGYGALDSDHDFFMDGGTDVTVESEEVINKNLEGIKNIILKENTDVVFLQEVDVDSKRSFGIDQKKSFYNLYEDDVQAFATNFLVDYIPYPFPDTIGKVNSGILTLNKYPAASAERIALPTSFSWPTRVAQLKRCLLVERVPIEGSNKELVLINLHLEAYDDGSGKEAQTKVLTELLISEYEKGNYCIAGGDFNQIFENTTPSYPIINEDYFVPGVLSTDILPEGWTFASDGTTPTARLLNAPYDASTSENQYFVIDGFILSPNIKLEEISTLNEGFSYSDHNPVRVKATLLK